MNAAPEVINYLDEKFAAIDKNFSGIEQKFADLEKDINRRFGTVMFRFDKIDERFVEAESQVVALKEELKSDIAKVDGRVSDMYTGLDKYTKKADDYFQEVAMLSNQVKRHEGWHQQVADKLGLKPRS